MAAHLPDCLLLLLKQLECSGFTVRKAGRIIFTDNGPSCVPMDIDLIAILPCWSLSCHLHPFCDRHSFNLYLNLVFFVLIKLYKLNRVTSFYTFSGLENICVDIECALGRKTGIYWRLCWSIFTPVIMITVFMYAMITAEHYKFGGNYEYPQAAYSEYLYISTISF